MSEEIRRTRKREVKVKQNNVKKDNAVQTDNEKFESSDIPVGPKDGKTRMGKNRNSGNSKSGKKQNKNNQKANPERILQNALFLSKREDVDRKMVIYEKNDITQVAILENDILVEHYISEDSDDYIAGGIFYGKVQNVLPSMEVAFVDIGTSKNGVLYSGEVNYDISDITEPNVKTIDKALKVGKNVLVQVLKDPFAKKGSRLTTEISIPGRFIVLFPNSKTIGISRRLPEKEKMRIRKIIKQILPKGMGVIVRTAAHGASAEDYKHDMDALLSQWEEIEKRTKTEKAPVQLYSEPKIEMKIVRDNFDNTFSELVISSTDETFNNISNYISEINPDLKDLITRAPKDDDIFKTMKIGEQISKALSRYVHLPSGGTLVIDKTEAMTVIDVNTGKFTGIKGQSLEETVTTNNLEAAEEIVNQLRIRDIAGIIVIDFIDMIIEKNRDIVLKRLIECLSRDKTSHQVTEITSLGLVQITRKRVGRGLLEVFSEKCQNCHGEGYIVNVKNDSIPEPVRSGSVIETSEKTKDSLKDIFRASKHANDNNNSDTDFDNSSDDVEEEDNESEED
ncbi:MAG: Rne/Rng family ribonuclease [Bifidobacteriaceae bacterium]|nr:Rne/Rng family ribonuclease [Bifidobacteriaceae bacterium]